MKVNAMRMWHATRADDTRLWHARQSRGMHVEAADAVRYSYGWESNCGASLRSVQAWLLSTHCSDAPPKHRSMDHSLAVMLLVASKDARTPVVSRL
jgi:hypothetical protein